MSLRRKSFDGMGKFGSDELLKGRQAIKVKLVWVT
jgi:hypothetical protein